MQHNIEVTRTSAMIDHYTCDACGNDIPLVYQESGNGKDMLTVRVYGSYGEYMDGEERSHLCSVCAAQLQDAWPILFSKDFDEKLSPQSGKDTR